MPCSHTAKCPIEGFAPTSPVWLVLLRYEKRLGAQCHMTLCQSWTRFLVNSILISAVPLIFFFFLSDRRKVLVVKKLLGLPGSPRAPSPVKHSVAGTCQCFVSDILNHWQASLELWPKGSVKEHRVTVPIIKQQTKTQTKEPFYSPSWTQKLTGMWGMLFPFKSLLEMHQWSLCHVRLLLFWDETVQKYAAVRCK